MFENLTGKHQRSFQIVYPGKRLTLTTYTHPHGKLEQHLIAPAE